MAVRFSRRLAVLVTLGMMLGAPAVLAQEKTLTAFVAASLKNALDDINAAYTRKTGIKIAASFGASSTLARQIEQGAPADVFISADLEWMDYAVASKTINEATRVNLLGNKLVLIAPKDSVVGNVSIGQGFDLARLAGDGRIATGDVQSVPVGKYAKAALEKLGSWTAASSKFASSSSVYPAASSCFRLFAFMYLPLDYFDP